MECKDIQTYLFRMNKFAIYCHLKSTGNTWCRLPSLDVCVCVCVCVWVGERERG